MRGRAVLTIWLALPLVSLTLGAPGARAEVGASGTRLSIAGGPARAYMTYGHADEPELYAPVMPELRRLQVTGVQRGEDYLIYRKGVKIADWPIVRSREDMPETGEHPCVLALGGNIFVPVRLLSTLLGLEVQWDRAGNLVSMLPGPARAQPVEVAADPGMALLDSVQLTQAGTTVFLRVRSSVPVRPTWLNLKGPRRIVLDFPNARWAPGIQLPPPGGVVTQLRTGQFTPGTARLVLTVPSAQVRLTGLSVTTDEIQASVGRGPQVARATVPPDVEARIREVLRLRRAQMAGLPSRGGPLDLGPVGNPELPILPGPEPPIFRPLPDPTGSLLGKVICVDAGHGGHSPGARGLNHLEKDLCLKMCLEFRRALEERGAAVIMPRESDVYVSLDDRCRFANTRRADIFVSIHCNSTPRRNSANGSETYWRTPQSSRLAQSLHPFLAATVGRRDGGIRNRSFAVIRETTMPSVLLEIAYINNSEDERLLATPEFHARLAQSLVAGVLTYFGTGGEIGP